MLKLRNTEDDFEEQLWASCQEASRQQEIAERAARHAANAHDTAQAAAAYAKRNADKLYELYQTLTKKGL